MESLSHRLDKALKEGRHVRTLDKGEDLVSPQNSDGVNSDGAPGLPEVTVLRSLGIAKAEEPDVAHRPDLFDLHCFTS